MTHIPLGIAPLSLLELTPPNRVSCAAEAGYTSTGLRLVAATPTEAMYNLVDDTPVRRKTERRLKETGLKVLDVEILRLQPETNVRNFLPVLDSAARFGASRALIAGNDENAARLADNFASLCELARPFGITIAIEPMPWTNVRDIKETAALLKKVGQPNMGVVLDIIHFDRSGSSVDDLALLPEGSISYLQICDGTKEKPADTEGLLYQARCYRLSPGRGGINMLPLLKALPKDLPVSVECVNEKLSYSVSSLNRVKEYLEDARTMLGKAGFTAN